MESIRPSSFERFSKLVPESFSGFLHRAGEMLGDSDYGSKIVSHSQEKTRSRPDPGMSWWKINYRFKIFLYLDGGFDNFWLITSHMCTHRINHGLQIFRHLQKNVSVSKPRDISSRKVRPESAVKTYLNVSSIKDTFPGRLDKMSGLVWQQIIVTCLYLPLYLLWTWTWLKGEGSNWIVEWLFVLCWAEFN